MDDNMRMDDGGSFITTGCFLAYLLQHMQRCSSNVTPRNNRKLCAVTGGRSSWVYDGRYLFIESTSAGGWFTVPISVCLFFCSHSRKQNNFIISTHENTNKVNAICTQLIIFNKSNLRHDFNESNQYKLVAHLAFVCFSNCRFWRRTCRSRLNGTNRPD